MARNTKKQHYSMLSENSPSIRARSQAPSPPPSYKNPSIEADWNPGITHNGLKIIIDEEVNGGERDSNVEELEETWSNLDNWDFNKYLYLLACKYSDNPSDEDWVPDRDKKQCYKAYPRKG
jgi:hypothetical protein